MDAAVATRLRATDMAVAERVLIAGMHLDFPAVNHVHVGTEARSYCFVPLPWQTAFPDVVVDPAREVPHKRLPAE